MPEGLKHIEWLTGFINPWWEKKNLEIQVSARFNIKT